MTAALRVGLVSDTHGLFDPRLPELLDGCDLILHAGDIVDPGILGGLARIAPVRAVRGNNDSAEPFRELPEMAVIQVGRLKVLLVHESGPRGRLLPPIRAALSGHGAQILVHGHSHRPSAALEGEVLMVNPGSAGPRRFRLPRSAGLLEIRGRSADVRLFDLAGAHLSLVAPPVGASW